MLLKNVSVKFNGVMNLMLSSVFKFYMIKINRFSKFFILYVQKSSLILLFILLLLFCLFTSSSFIVRVQCCIGRVVLEPNLKILLKGPKIFLRSTRKFCLTCKHTSSNKSPPPNRICFPLKKRINVLRTLLTCLIPVNVEKGWMKQCLFLVR